jgi:hypothetical protein
VLHKASDEVAAMLKSAHVDPPHALVEDEDEAPVFVWRRDPFAAVMRITYFAEDDEDPYWVDVDVYELVDGAWGYVGSGGSDWPMRYGERPPGQQPSLTGFAMAINSDADGHEYLWTGIAPVSVPRVRVLTDGFESMVEVEPISGAFLVVGPMEPPTLAAAP